MKLLLRSDKRNKELMVKLYRHQWNMLKLNPDLSKKEACSRTLTENGFNSRICHINHRCFLCAYVVAIEEHDDDATCDSCPIIWPEVEGLSQELAPCKKSYYGQWTNTTTPQGELGKLAGIISKLPEKEEL